MTEIGRTSEHNGWIAQTDHEAAGMAVREMMFNSGDINLAMNAMISEQRAVDERSYRELSMLGSYMVPLGPDGTISDDTTKFEVFMVGMNLALASLDALCDSINIDVEIDDFRRIWREKGLTLVLNLSDQRVQAQSLQERYESVGQGIMEHGYRAMEDIGNAYDSLLDTATDTYPSVGANPGTLKAAFGYILSGGLRRLNAVVEEREFQKLFEVSSFDESAHATDAGKVPKEAAPAYRPIEHGAIAYELDTTIFYGEVSAEEYLGQLAQTYLDSDERPIEILNTLALVAQPNELGNSALDEAGEAFFYGGILALDVISRHAAVCAVGQRSVTKSWRKQRAHVQTDAIESGDDPAMDVVNEHIAGVLNRADLTDAYDELLIKLADQLGYDEEESIAAFNGFHYMLLTGTDALKGAVNRVIGETVKDEMIGFEAELARLLEG